MSCSNSHERLTESVLSQMVTLRTEPDVSEPAKQSTNRAFQRSAWTLEKQRASKSDGARSRVTTSGQSGIDFQA